MSRRPSHHSLPVAAELHAEAVAAVDGLSVVASWADTSLDAVAQARVVAARLRVDRVLWQLDRRRPATAPLAEARAVLRRLDAVAKLAGADPTLAAFVAEARDAVEQLAERLAGRGHRRSTPPSPS